MWKLIIGFIVFAGLALFILSKGGDIDMSGEKHGVESHEPAASAAASAASLPASATAAMPAAAASAAASAASN